MTENIVELNPIIEDSYSPIIEDSHSKKHVLQVKIDEEMPLNPTTPVNVNMRPPLFEQEDLSQEDTSPLDLGSNAPKGSINPKPSHNQSL